MGKNGLVDFERETELSGSSYDKGSLILQGFLAGRFGQSHPLTFAASICFEQSYGYIDGDSASSTELYALLSSLAGVAIRQDRAVTGSVDQFGNVQTIGGVNEKVEGFFDLCAQRGLTGDQGVVIPAKNLDDLMLAPRVVAAIGADQFHVWPVTTIDEGVEILMDVQAGERSSSGRWSEGSMNAAVQKSLDRLSKLSNESGD